MQRVAAEFPALASGRAVFAALGTPRVRQLVDEWIGEMLLGLVGVIHCFNPAAVVLGGGILREGYLLEQLSARLYPLLKPSFRDVALRAAALGNEAGLYGAGMLARAL